jgi:hypothetical protein
MNNYQFISYEKTPNDTLQLGIATILAGDFLIRYRHMQKKDGSSTYFAAPSVSITDAQQQKKYHDGFEIDSRSKQELLMAFIRKHVAQSLEESRSVIQPSVFSQAATSQNQPDEGVPF